MLGKIIIFRNDRGTFSYFYNFPYRNASDDEMQMEFLILSNFYCICIEFLLYQTQTQHTNQGDTDIHMQHSYLLLIETDQNVHVCIHGYKSI